MHTSASAHQLVVGTLFLLTSALQSQFTSNPERCPTACVTVLAARNAGPGLVLQTTCTEAIVSDAMAIPRAGVIMEILIVVFAQG